MLISGADISEAESEDSLFLQIEFPGGYKKSDVDKTVSEWVQRVKSHEGISKVQSGASLGSATVLINFNPAILTNAKVREIVNSTPVDGGFAYISEDSLNEKIWEIKVFGDSIDVCRTIVEEAASLCAELPVVRGGGVGIMETVFNFKEAAPNLLFMPERDKIAFSQKDGALTFSAIANEIRTTFFGPVVYKRLDTKNDNGETDVRIKNMGSGTPAKSDIKNIVLANGSGAIKLNSVMKSENKASLTGTSRENRRRFLSMSIKTKAADPRVISNIIMPVLNQIELKPGYSIEFDRNAIESAEKLSQAGYYFILALLFCYIVIAITNESLLLPFIILSVVPPSVAVPALFLGLGGVHFSAASASAFILVSGMAVNSAVLITSEIKSGDGIIVKSVMNKMSALLATSATTIITAVPFLFLGEGVNLIIKTLSLVMVLGIAASCVFSLLLIPALCVSFSIFKPERSFA
jgi:multidrug efflux pump subunit AcrB